MPNWKSPERVAVLDPLLESVREAIDRFDLDDPLDLRARREAQRRGDDHSEQAVPTTDQREQLTIFRTVAADRLTSSIDDRQILYVADEWPHHQSASVNVRRERAPDREAVGAGLLLANPPALRVDAPLVRREASRSPPAIPRPPVPRANPYRDQTAESCSPPSNQSAELPSRTAALPSRAGFRKPRAPQRRAARRARTARHAPPRKDDESREPASHSAPSGRRSPQRRLRRPARRAAPHTPRPEAAPAPAAEIHAVSCRPIVRDGRQRSAAAEVR